MVILQFLVEQLLNKFINNLHVRKISSLYNLEDFFRNDLLLKFFSWNICKFFNIFVFIENET